MDQAVEALPAFREPPRTSRGLYEIAWVHIRWGILRGPSVPSRSWPSRRRTAASCPMQDPAGNLLFATAGMRRKPGVPRGGAGVRPFVASSTRSRRSTEPGPVLRQLVRDNMEAFDANAFLPPWLSAGEPGGDMDAHSGPLRPQPGAQARSRNHVARRASDAAVSQPNLVACSGPPDAAQSAARRCGTGLPVSGRR